MDQVKGLVGQCGAVGGRVEQTHVVELRTGDELSRGEEQGGPLLHADHASGRHAASTERLQDPHGATAQIDALPAGLDVDLVEPGLDLRIPYPGLEPGPVRIPGVQMEGNRAEAQSTCRSSEPV